MKNFSKFMYNRYGIDDLYNFLLKIYLVIFIVNLFIKSSILNFIELILVSIILFRFLSKNKYNRSLENKKYLNIKNKIVENANYFITKYKDDFIYKRCPKCKKLLKLPLPYKKGVKCVKCPKCNKVFKMLVLKKTKIEIISNKK